MNNLEPLIRLFTTLAESFRSAVDHRTAQLDFERIKWERHEDIEQTKRLLLVLQLFLLTAIFSLLLFRPWPETLAKDHLPPSVERSVTAPPAFERVTPLPAPWQPKPEPSLPTVWRYSL